MFNETLEFYCFFSQKENLDSNIPHSISFSFRALSLLAFHYEKSRYLLILIVRHSRNMRVLIEKKRERLRTRIEVLKIYIRMCSFCTHARFRAQQVRFIRADNIKVDHRFEMIRNGCVIVNSVLRACCYISTVDGG